MENGFHLPQKLPQNGHCVYKAYCKALGIEKLRA